MAQSILQILLRLITDRGHQFVNMVQELKIIHRQRTNKIHSHVGQNNLMPPNYIKFNDIILVEFFLGEFNDQSRPVGNTALPGLCKRK